MPAAVRPAPLRLAFQAMACPCEVVIGDVLPGETRPGLAPDQARRLAEQAAAEVQRIEAKYSRYRPDSIVSRLQAAAGGEALACDAETLALLDYAHTLYTASDGLFDITSGVLRRAWDFKRCRVPTEAELATLLPLIGWPRVEREGGRVRLPQAGMQLDFGGFGKEYAADRAGALLATAGVHHGYVNLGGDLRVIGPRPDGTPWRIGIQHPRRPQTLLATLPMVHGGLATSGDYERFFEHGGQRYCHVLDPRSGWPVSHWRSVSVRAPLAVVAGNASTITMLKGEAGLAWLQATGLDFLAVDRHGTIHQTAAAPQPSAMQPFASTAEPAAADAAGPLRAEI